MDVQMPIMDGYTATRRIKADGSLRSIPITVKRRSRLLQGNGDYSHPGSLLRALSPLPAWSIVA